MVELKRSKMIQSNGIDLPEGQNLKSLEEGEGYRYLGILESDKVKSVEMKDILRKEYYHRVRKILRSSLNAGNTIQAINSRAVFLIRYGAGIIEWTKEDTRQMDRKTRKLFTMHRSMHPQSDVDWLYWKRNEGGRGLQSIEEVVEIERASLGFYLHQADEFMLKEIVQEGLFRDSTDPVDKKRELVDKHKLQFEEKKLHSVFFRETKGVRDEKDTWLWLKKETEGLILAAQEQALRLNWVKRMIDTEECHPDAQCVIKKMRQYHLLYPNIQLAQKEYKKCRHDKIAAIIYYSSKKFGFSCCGESYEHFVGKGYKDFRKRGC